MSYIDVTGKTEEEAIAKALEQLGLDRDEVSVEILERAKSGFLGLGASPARVRVSYGPEEMRFEEPAPAAPAKPAVPEKPKAQSQKKAEKKSKSKAVTEKRTESGFQNSYIRCI